MEEFLLEEVILVVGGSFSCFHIDFCSVLICLIVV